MFYWQKLTIWTHPDCKESGAVASALHQLCPFTLGSTNHSSVHSVCCTHFRGCWFKCPLDISPLQNPFSAVPPEEVCVCVCIGGVGILPFCFLLYAVAWLIRVGFPQQSVLSLQASSLYWTEWLSYVWAPRAEFHTYIQQHQKLALINRSHWPWKDMGIRTRRDMPSKSMKQLSIWERCAGFKKKIPLCP